MSFSKLSLQNKQAFLLLLTTFFGTAIGVLNSVINTRNLDVVSYGNVQYILNIVSFISSILLLGYFQTGSRLLALSSNENESKRIRGVLIMYLGIAITTIILCLFIIYAVHLIYNPKVAYLFLIVIPFSGNVMMLNYVNTTAQGDNHIGRISIARVLPSLAYAIIALLIYKRFGATSGIMLLLQTSIPFLILLMLIFSTKPSFYGLKNSLQKLNLENKKYGIQIYYGSLAMLATSYISGITLGLFNPDNAKVGYYNLALTVASPLAIIPSIIGTTYFKKFASQPFIEKTVIKSTLLITMVSCIVFILIIRPLVSFLYSDEYNLITSFAIILAIGNSIHGFGDLINRFLGSHGKGKQIRNGSLISGAILVFGSIVFVYFFGLEGAVATKVLSSLSYSVVLIYYYIQYISLKANG